MLLDALDEITGIAFTSSGDDHNVFGVNYQPFHTLSILDLFLSY